MALCGRSLKKVEDPCLIVVVNTLARRRKICREIIFSWRLLREITSQLKEVMSNSYVAAVCIDVVFFFLS